MLYYSLRVQSHKRVAGASQFCMVILAYNTAGHDEPEDRDPARGAGADSGGVGGDDWGLKGRGGELGDWAEELARRARFGIWWWGRGGGSWWLLDLQLAGHDREGSEEANQQDMPRPGRNL